MATDVQAAGHFYATPCGAIAARLLRGRLALLWPGLRGETVLGPGYAAPFLRLWREQAARCVAMTQAQLGAMRWPASAANLACTAEEDALPFPDLVFDRILLVHGLESADNARRLLREVWRVLKDDGRLMVIAPNRRGLWAWSDHTPFGHGQPYTAGQIGRLLASSLFRVERRDTALFMPPTQHRMVLRSAKLWEEGGRLLAPRLAGVTLAEAAKDVHAAIPLYASPRRRLMLAEAA